MKPINIVGIDLGTTKSVIAVWDEDSQSVNVLQNRNGKRITPSVVAIDPITGASTVGDEALVGLLTAPENTLYSVKRFIGRRTSDSYFSIDRNTMSYEVISTPEDQVLIEVGARRYTPAQISAEVLKKVVADGCDTIGNPVHRAVISVPAYFNEYQRQATQEAGRLAGLTVERIINEPTAAALAFGLGAQEETIAVFDFGGGTFDISIIDIKHGMFTVKAVGGDTHLGGDDMDGKLVEWLWNVIATQHPEIGFPSGQDPYTKENQATLREAVKAAKIRLSDEESTSISIPTLHLANGSQLSVEATLTRQTLENEVMPILAKTFPLMDRTLKNANRTPAQLSQILLVGGPTRMPIFRRELERYYNRPINNSIPPEEAVARGAALLGGRLAKVPALRHRIGLRDVNAHAIWLKQRNQHNQDEFGLIFAANQEVPHEHVGQWATTRDQQSQLIFELYQGNDQKDLVQLGRLELLFMAPKNAGEVVNCTFRLDENGTLRVIAYMEKNPAEKLNAIVNYKTAKAPND